MYCADSILKNYGLISKLSMNLFMNVYLLWFIFYFFFGNPIGFLMTIFT
jgi:hypothetical protein